MFWRKLWFKYKMVSMGFLLIALLITGCAKLNKMKFGAIEPHATLVTAAEVEDKFSTVYLVTRRGGYMVPVNSKLTNTERPVWATLEKLICGYPVEDGLRTPIPTGTKIRDMYIRDGIAYVDLSYDFIKITEIESGDNCRRAVEAIVWTLTEFPDIDKVQILLDGIIHEEPIGEVAIDIPLERPQWLNHVNDEPGDNSVVLYFAYQGKFLVPVSKTIRDFSQSASQVALEELFKGPEGLVGLDSAIPQGVVLEDYKVEQETAYVNLAIEGDGADHFWGYDGKPLRALAATLLEFPHIEKVKILVEGKIVATVNNGTVITDENLHHPLTNFIG